MASRAKTTLEDIMRMDRPYLVPVEVADVLGCSSYAINVAAKKAETRDMLGFPVVKIGTRCKIPRIPFLHYMGVEAGE